MSDLWRYVKSPEIFRIGLNHLILLKVAVEMPGMKEDKNYMMSEINYENYERDIVLPDSVDMDKAKASFKNGTFWIDMPKKPV